MKKTLIFIFIFFILSLLFFLTGCQQVSNKTAEIQDQAQKTYQDLQNQAQKIQTQIETTKTQAIETGDKINQKINQAKEAADAVGKLVQ